MVSTKDLKVSEEGCTKSNCKVLEGFNNKIDEFKDLQGKYDDNQNWRENVANVLEKGKVGPEEKLEFISKNVRLENELEVAKIERGDLKEKAKEKDTEIKTLKEELNRINSEKIKYRTEWERKTEIKEQMGIIKKLDFEKKGAEIELNSMKGKLDDFKKKLEDLKKTKEKEKKDYKELLSKVKKQRFTLMAIEKNLKKAESKKKTWLDLFKKKEIKEKKSVKIKEAKKSIKGVLKVDKEEKEFAKEIVGELKALKEAIKEMKTESKISTEGLPSKSDVEDNYVEEIRKEVLEMMGEGTKLDDIRKEFKKNYNDGNAKYRARYFKKAKKSLGL